jgi:hypothetical protein
MQNYRKTKCVAAPFTQIAMIYTINFQFNSEYISLLSFADLSILSALFDLC